MTLTDYLTTGGQMADKKQHETMNAHDLLKYVKAHHDDSAKEYVSDEEKRATALHGILEWYSKPSNTAKIQEEITKPFDDIKLNKYEEMHKKIKDAHKDRVSRGGKRLTQKQADDLLEELVNQMLPDMKIGVKDDKEHNKNHFKLMLNALKQYVGEEKGAALERELYSAIREGEGYKASNAVREIVKSYHTIVYQNELLEGIINPANKQYVDKYSGLIKKLAETETGEKFVKGHLEQNIVKAAQVAAKGDYVELFEYRPEPPVKPKHEHKKAA